MSNEEDTLIYRLKVEDRELEPVDNYDVFETHREAMEAFHACVSDHDMSIGTVYVTADDGYDEWVIVAHSFV